MKFTKTKLALATALVMAFSNVNAAVIVGDTVLINILKDGPTGESMLIDTNLKTRGFVEGTITSWSANTDLTSAINAFIGNSTNVIFYAAGVYRDNFFNKHGLSNVALPGNNPAVNQFVDVSLQVFADRATIKGFSDATVGLTETWKAGIPDGDEAHYGEVNLRGNGLVGDSHLGTAAPFFDTQTGFFLGTNDFVYNDWNLNADGSLTYGAVSAVPVPAAAWLFGSGLLGLVGVARRKA